MGFTVYIAPKLGTKEKIKHSVRSREITLSPDEDTAPKGQIELVRKRMDIVAEETAIYRIEMMVRLNKNVPKCVHRNNETITELIARLKITSLAYRRIERAG